MLLVKLALFAQYTLQASGSPISGLMVVDALREIGFQVYTAYHEPGDILVQYREKCIGVFQLDHGRWLAGGPWHRRLRRLLADLRAARRFAHRFRELRPALVYVNNLTGLAAALAARWLRIPCVWHLRELFDDVEGEMHPPWPGGKWTVRRLVRGLPQQIVAISQAVVENVVGACDLPNLTVLPNAVGDEFFACPYTPAEARARLGLPAEALVIGVPGTLRPVKGHRFFLEAFAEVARQMPSCIAAITGDGQPRYEHELRQVVDDRGLSEKVVFLGTVADMPAFYRACDVVCVPSRSESFGRAAIEAMACNTPVVATAVGGMRETLQHERTGLLVPYGQTGGLATAMLRLLRDGWLRDRLASAARAEAEARYGQETCMKRISRIVAQLHTTKISL